ncbi:AIM24 family protein [Kitasatospora atroaurantiaca]|uniref:Uncharacterized protein (AIM24 family) n=2 Tax=Kitasatospora atroaurantiaca TaxID=285545 RepID=A0A561EVA1_9ACTN|nr:uncharacterized protein (AIM24 family) [Kitasatospora atroaurantiaca]
MAGDSVKARNGCMVAYTGQMNFKKLSGGGDGLRGMVTRRLTGEQMEVMEVKGQGTCYFADKATEVNLVRLNGETLFVESDNLLCTEATLHTGTSFTGLNGMASGNGLFTTKVEGSGWAALTSKGPAIILRVSQGMPLRVDPGAYVAHTGSLNRSLKSGAGWTTLIGEGGGEAMQVEFTGEGLVYVQPSEKMTFGGDV